MNETIYSPQDLADIVGMSIPHLTRSKDGPIARILETHHWETERISPDGKSLTEYGLDILENYLSEVGKAGKGLSYENWQKSRRAKFAPNQSAIATSEQLPLIPVSTYTPQAGDFQLMPFNLTQELEAWASQQANVTKQKTLDFFRQAVTIPAVQGIAEGQAELKEILSKLGA